MHIRLGPARCTEQGARGRHKPARQLAQGRHELETFDIRVPKEEFVFLREMGKHSSRRACLRKGAMTPMSVGSSPGAAASSPLTSSTTTLACRRSTGQGTEWWYESEVVGRYSVPSCLGPRAVAWRGTCMTLLLPRCVAGGWMA